MGDLRYSINITLDGCCDHEAVDGDEALHEHAAANLERADAMLLGRVTYQMMESAFRADPTAPAGPDDPFARSIDAVRKHVVSRTLDHVDWNAELVRGDLGEAVRRLKDESPRGLAVGGVQLPLALAELGLIDEYELVVHPRIAGRGPTVLAGLSTHVDLVPVDRFELSSGALVLRYVSRR